jgi:23S rRNA (uracil1939-C5)-methyltransferase
MKLTLEKAVYGGDCLARGGDTEGKAGKAVFVQLTLPGETVTAHLTEEKRSFAKAEVDEVLVASPNRVAPRCPYFGACGGCQYQHADYATQLAMKQQILRETLARAGVTVPSEIGVLAGDPWGYRNRIRVAFTPEGGFGYRGRGSHSIVPIGECPIAAPMLVQVAKQIAKFAAENSNVVTISELELFANRDETQILLTLFCEQPAADGAHAWLAALQAALPPQVTGLRLQLADGSLNPRILASVGEAQLTYFAAGFGYRVDHGAFFQVNRWLIGEFVELVIETHNGGTHSGKTAWDLFAGVGLFARALTANFAQVLAVESAQASFAALRHNLEGTTGRAVGSTTLDFLRRNREQREAGPDLIVLDPPRAGLGEETTRLLNAIGAPEMVYVSCDPTTLTRDLRALTGERYKVEKITLVDMFPQTFHMETVVHLRRS